MINISFVSSKAFFAVCIYVILFSNFAAAQQAIHFHKTENISPQNCLEIELENPATSLTIQFPETDHHSRFSIYANGEKYLVQQDVDAEEINGKVFSQLAVFPKAVSRVTICSEDYSGKIDVHFLQVPYIAFDKNAFRQTRNKKGCEKPVTVDQDIWRVGLNPPTIKPAQNKVTHIIVHHTATPNSDSNYVNVMRNIYAYHTQVNGWDDIGYNFLVAPDGTIFQGRDGQGVDEDDNVIGAHFCAKNRGTMGISMIGDYQTVPPTDAAMMALEKLIAWKLNKENLNAQDSALHNGEWLNTISGHRDGCATLCPGDSLYIRLTQVRNNVEALMEDCTPPIVGISPSKHFSEDVYMQYQSANIEIIIRSDKAENYTFTLVDMHGKIWKSGKINVGLETVSVRDLPNGIYIFKLNNSDGKNTLKFVKF